VDGDLDGKHPSVTIAIAWGLYLVLLVALGVLLLRGDRDQRSDL
jgi:hypothetical protein